MDQNWLFLWAGRKWPVFSVVIDWLDFCVGGRNGLGFCMRAGNHMSFFPFVQIPLLASCVISMETGGWNHRNGAALTFYANLVLPVFAAPPCIPLLKYHTLSPARLGASVRALILGPRVLRVEHLRTTCHRVWPPSWATTLQVFGEWLTPTTGGSAGWRQSLLLYINMVSHGLPAKGSVQYDSWTCRGGMLISRWSITDVRKKAPEVPWGGLNLNVLLRTSGPGRRTPSLDGCSLLSFWWLTKDAETYRNQNVLLKYAPRNWCRL